MIQCIRVGGACGYDNLYNAGYGVLGGIGQNNVASTIRMTEGLADPTAALALEAAVRRRARPDETVRLCAACRVLRLQPVPPGPGFTQHFAVFALVTAGRAQPSHGFEIEALHELQPPAGAEDPVYYDYVTVEWGRRWPAEEIWVARKAS